MMNKLQGGPNLINIEMRLSAMETRFEEDLEIRLQNKTDEIVERVDGFEGAQVRQFSSWFQPFKINCKKITEIKRTL